MNTDLDSQIRNLFEGVEDSQEPITLDEIQIEQVRAGRAEATLAKVRRRRPLLVAVVVVIVAGSIVLLAQRPDDRAVLVTQPELATAVATPDGQDPESDTDHPRIVISPLVDIRSQLVNQPDVEVFTVESPTRDYWRITSLDVFDGRIWRSRGTFEHASGSLETDLPRGTNFTSVTQTFNIKALGGIWLPAAYEPAEIVAGPPDVGFEYERQSGTLIVNRDLADSDGLTYSVISAVPERTKAAIEAAGTSVPEDIRDRYTELPVDFSPRVTRLAMDVTATASTPYEKALALQNFFRDDSRFGYDLDVSNGHSSERLEAFLFEARVGYSEQFAGAYAAMARAIGLPARVAVGFTTGEFDPSINAYRVTGKHAHAWPEVWLDGIGWLRFEPTPARGAPGDQSYTGQVEAQASTLPER